MLPRKATHLEVQLIAARIDFVTGRVTGTVSQSRFLDLAQPFEGIQFDANVPKNVTLIIAFQFNAYQHKLPLLDKRYLATDLIAVKLPVKQTMSNKHRKQAKKISPAKSRKPQRATHWQPVDPLLPVVLAHHFSNGRSRLNEQRE